jgi:hypothetical protein
MRRLVFLALFFIIFVFGFILGIASSRSGSSSSTQESNKSKTVETPENNEQFKGFIASGSAQLATDKFYLPKGLRVFKMSHAGSGNFAVWLLNDKGEREELLVNEVGSFNGSKALGIENEGDYLLDVNASGNWGIIVE